MASGSGSGLTAADIINTFYRLKASYRANGVWIMNSATLGAVRALADTTGRPLWAASLAPGQPETLLGRPVVECEAMPNVGAGALPIAVGDRRRALILYTRCDASVLRDPYSKARSGLTCFHLLARFGAAVVNFEALKLTVVSA